MEEAEAPVLPTSLEPVSAQIPESAAPRGKRGPPKGITSPNPSGKSKPIEEATQSDLRAALARADAAEAELAEAREKLESAGVKGRVKELEGKLGVAESRIRELESVSGPDEGAALARETILRTLRDE